MAGARRALAAFGRLRLAAALVAATLAVADARIAMAVFALAALAFAGARPLRRLGIRLAIVFAGLVLLARLLPFVLAPLAGALPSVGASTVAAMIDWRSLVAADIPHALTGHGLDQARLGVLIGFLPPHAPRTILFEVWYDLGLPSRSPRC